MKEKIEQIILIIKGKAVSMDYFKEEVRKLAIINGVEKYHRVSVNSTKFGNEYAYKTTFTCYIDGYRHTPDFNTIEESLRHMRSQINPPIESEKETEILL